MSVLAVLLLLGLVSGCGSDKKADPKPTAAASSETNQDRYQEALARFTEYEKVSEPIWAKGKYTPQAAKLLDEYWSTTGPEPVPATPQVVADARLRQADANQIQLKGLPEVLSSKPSQVNEHQVRIEQCVDGSQQTLYQYGKKVPPTAAGPVTRRITLVRNQPRQPWLIASLDDRPNASKPCHG